MTQDAAFSIIDNKKCRSCEQLLPSDNYYKSKAGYLNAYCKLCVRKISTANRARRSRADETATTKSRQQQRKQKAVEYKGGKCEDCAGVYPPYVYDFHHLDPSQKEYSIANRLGKGFSLEKVKPELDKCVLLCANCHRIRHGR